MGARDSRSRCTSGKLTFRDEASANRAVQRALVRGEIRPLKHYHCPLCNLWHLATKKTTMEKRIERALNDALDRLFAEKDTT
jgi:hypothetical protein